LTASAKCVPSWNEATTVSYIYIYTYICTYTHVYIYIYIYTPAGTCVHMCIRIYIYLDKYVRIYMEVQDGGASLAYIYIYIYNSFPEDMTKHSPWNSVLRAATTWALYLAEHNAGEQCTCARMQLMMHEHACMHVYTTLYIRTFIYRCIATCTRQCDPVVHPPAYMYTNVHPPAYMYTYLYIYTRRLANRVQMHVYTHASLQVCMQGVHMLVYIHRWYGRHPHPRGCKKTCI
jgi:hypothetical protein